MAHGTHDVDDDPRNAGVLISVNGDLVPRERATVSVSVSVFDSGFVLGDGVWEGIRVHHGRPAFLDQHLDRLYEGAHALMIDIGLSRDELARRIDDTITANEMHDGVHIRLMVTRGMKRTPYQDPRLTVGPATVVIIAEQKEPLSATVSDGITLFTTHVRRATPDTLDPKLNAHSKLNHIVACIQAYTAGAVEALVLDPHGFVATATARTSSSSALPATGATRCERRTVGSASPASAPATRRTRREERAKRPTTCRLRTPPARERRPISRCGPDHGTS